MKWSVKALMPLFLLLAHIRMMLWLLEKNLCDLFLKFGPGNFHYAVACLDGVPESRQIICYGISHFFDV